MKKLICMALCVLMIFALAACQNGGTTEKGNVPIETLSWGMTQEEALAALEGMDWEYTGDHSILVAYEKPIFGAESYSYRGQPGSVELVFTREAVVDGKTVAPALCGIHFVVDAASLDELAAGVEKLYGEASSAGEAYMGWQLPWGEGGSPRVKTVAALLHSGVTGDLADHCAQYGVQGVFPYDEALCKETWQTWEDVAAKLDSTYGPVIKLNDHEGQITVACEAQLAAYVPQLEKLL